MVRKVGRGKSEARSKVSRAKARPKSQAQSGRVMKNRQAKMKTTSKKQVTEQVRRIKRGTSPEIKIKISREVLRKGVKGKKKKHKKYRSTDYKRVGLDHPTSSPAIANMSENDRIKCAMNDLAAGKYKFVSKAAAYWRVHAAKLYRRHSGGVPLDAKRGPRKVLTQREEESLVEWVVTMGKRGFPVAPGMVCDAVKTFFKKDSNPFTNDRPSHTWYHKFIRRHPRLLQGLKLSRLTAICRTDLTKAMIDEWFRELQRFLFKLGVADKPDQIWSFGQTGFEMNKTTERIVMMFSKPTGKAPASSADYDEYNERREVNVYVCANAVGNLLPPFIICKGLKRIPEESDFLADAPRGSGKLLLEGYTGNELNFGLWIKNHLVPNLGEKRPVVLLVDFNDNEISYGAYAAATQHDIHLFHVPPQAASLLQPLDVGEEGPFKSNWLVRWVKRNRHVPVNFENVGSVIGEAWVKAENPEAIRTCFIQSGVYPIDREMVDDEHLPTGTFEFLDAVHQSDDDDADVDVVSDDVDNATDVCNNQSLTQESIEESISESKQPIAALLLFQKLDDTLDKPTREMYRTCIENGLDLEEAPLFSIWKKFYTEAFKNDPNVPLTSVEEVVVTTTTPEKSTVQNSKESGLSMGVSEERGEEAICPVCKEQFGEDEEEWIGCDGDCQLWYHVNCLPPEVVTPAILEDKEMFCPQCRKSRKPEDEYDQQ